MEEVDHMGLEMYQSPEIKALALAIVQAQKNLKPAKRDATNSFFKSTYAPLPTCWEAISSFRDQDIAIVQCPMPSEPHTVALDTMLIHAPTGQYIRSRLIMPLAKVDPQGAGSAITYARRYALGCMTGLVTDEDDDGNQASSQPARIPFKPVPKPAAAQSPVGDIGVFIWQYGPKFKGYQIVDIPTSNLEWFLKNERTPDDHKEAASMELDRRNAAELFAEEATER
jgi:hypothetical protein